MVVKNCCLLTHCITYTLIFLPRLLSLSLSLHMGIRCASEILTSEKSDSARKGEEKRRRVKTWGERVQLKGLRWPEHAMALLLNASPGCYLSRFSPAFVAAMKQGGGLFGQH